MSTKNIAATVNFNYSPTPKYYTEEEVDKLLIGIHMLGGVVCPTCGTVHLRSTKCPVCSIKKYL